MLASNGLDIQAKLIVWIFAMRVLMVITSIVSYWINGAISPRAVSRTRITSISKRR